MSETPFCSYKIEMAIVIWYFIDNACNKYCPTICHKICRQNPDVHHKSLNPLPQTPLPSSLNPLPSSHLHPHPQADGITALDILVA